MIDDLPPGGAWMRVEDRSVMTFPAFWFEPVANLFEDVPRVVFCTGAGADARTFVLDVSVNVRPVLLLLYCWAGLLSEKLPPPKEICERPPGGAWIRVDERFVITLPAFWFEPLAK